MLREFLVGFLIVVIVGLLQPIFAAPALAQANALSSPSGTTGGTTTAQELSSDAAQQLDSVLGAYRSAGQGWAEVLMGYARELFWSLVVIGMVWKFGMMALRKADLQEFFAEFVRFTIVIGFFWWLVIHGPRMAYDIISSMEKMAWQASRQQGVPNIGPGHILWIGSKVFWDVTAHLSFSHVVEGLAEILICLIVMIALVVVAVEIVLQLTASYVLIYAGVIGLGFGALEWTRDWAINYYRTVLSTALHLFTIILLVGAVEGFLNIYAATVLGGPTKAVTVSLQELSVLMDLVLIFAILILKAPPMVAGIITGASAGNAAGGAGLLTMAAGVAMTGATGGVGAAARLAKDKIAAAGGVIPASKKIMRALGKGGGGGPHA